MRIRRYNGRIVAVKITKRELQMVEDLWNQRFNANYKSNTITNR